MNTIDSNRGATTRRKLIESAIAIFGRDGFDAASTRNIAARAGVNQALIGYHFGGKKGLYLAAMEHIAEMISNHMLPKAEKVRDTLSQQSSREEYLENLLSLLDSFVDLLIGKDAAVWAAIILREQQFPSEAFELLYNSIMKDLLELTTLLIAKIQGTDPTAESVRLFALTVFGQAVVFRASRAAVMKHLDWSDIGDSEAQSIKQQIRWNVNQLLLL